MNFLKIVKSSWLALGLAGLMAFAPMQIQAASALSSDPAIRKVEVAGIVLLSVLALLGTTYSVAAVIQRLVYNYKQYVASSSGLGTTPEFAQLVQAADKTGLAEKMGEMISSSDLKELQSATFLNDDNIAQYQHDLALNIMKNNLNVKSTSDDGVIRQYLEPLISESNVVENFKSTIYEARNITLNINDQSIGFESLVDGNIPSSNSTSFDAWLDSFNQVATKIADCMAASYNSSKSMISGDTIIEAATSLGGGVSSQLSAIDGFTALFKGKLYGVNVNSSADYLGAAYQLNSNTDPSQEITLRQNLCSVIENDRNYGLTTAQGDIYKISASLSGPNSNGTEWYSNLSELLVNLDNAYHAQIDKSVVSYDDIISYIARDPINAISNLQTMQKIFNLDAVNTAADLPSVIQNYLINKATESLGLDTAGTTAYKDLYNDLDSNDDYNSAQAVINDINTIITSVRNTIPQGVTLSDSQILTAANNKATTENTSIFDVLESFSKGYNANDYVLNPNPVPHGSTSQTAQEEYEQLESQDASSIKAAESNLTSGNETQDQYDTLVDELDEELEDAEAAADTEAVEQIQQEMDEDETLGEDDDLNPAPVDPGA